MNKGSLILMLSRQNFLTVGYFRNIIFFMSVMEIHVCFNQIKYIVISDEKLQTIKCPRLWKQYHSTNNRFILILTDGRMSGGKPLEVHVYYLKQFTSHEAHVYYYEFFFKKVF